MHLKVEFLKHQMEAAQQVHLIVHMVVLLIIIPVPFINVIIMAQKLVEVEHIQDLQLQIRQDLLVVLQEQIPDIFTIVIILEQLKVEEDIMLDKMLLAVWEV